MTIVRWEPLRELGTLQSEMNRLFNTVFDGPGMAGNGVSGGTMRRWMPAASWFGALGRDRGAWRDRTRGRSPRRPLTRAAVGIGRPPVVL